MTVASALLTCVIVVSPGSNGDVNEKYWHEMAHCNGWVHPEKVSTEGEAYQAPRKYRYVYEGPIELYNVSQREARRICGGHKACQWFK